MSEVKTSIPAFVKDITECARTIIDTSLHVHRNEYSEDSVECHFCDAYLDYDGTLQQWEEFQHDPTCPVFAAERVAEIMEN